MTDNADLHVGHRLVENLTTIRQIKKHHVNYIRQTQRGRVARPGTQLEQCLHFESRSVCGMFEKLFTENGMHIPSIGVYESSNALTIQEDTAATSSRRDSD